MSSFIVFSFGVIKYIASIAGRGSRRFSMVSTTAIREKMPLSYFSTSLAGGGDLFYCGTGIVNIRMVSSSLLVIPSAESSCILVHADTIFMDCISTINTRHSSFPGALFKAVVARMTSFMISEVQNYAIISINFQSI